MKKKTKYEIQDFLLEDLKTHHGQSSWDYPADHRFAVFLGDTEAADILVEIMNSSTVWCFIIAAHEVFAGKIKRKRLTALRQLIRQGKIRAQLAVADDTAYLAEALEVFCQQNRFQ